MKSINRILTETIARKAINDIKDSPERKSRNLVDLALNFAEGQYLRDFLFKVQKVLQDENSPYYRMVIDAMNHIDTEKLIEFGMNIGFNSITQGSPKIRAIEQEEHFDIPWSMFADMSEYQSKRDYNAYKKIFSESLDLGIYSFHIKADKELKNLIKLLSEHKDMAFVLFVEPFNITEELLIEVKNVNNIMFVVKAAEETDKACLLLRSYNMLYSIYYVYGDKDESLITGDEFILYHQTLRPVFTCFVAESGCSTALREKVYRYIKDSRVRQEFLTIPWDIVNDTKYIDGKISDNICSAGIDKNGYLFKLSEGVNRTEYNVFEITLHDALKKALPKA